MNDQQIWKLSIKLTNGRGRIHTNPKIEIKRNKETKNLQFDETRESL